ncbi:MAG: twin-arginine translocation signal domain-containing protein [Candidatus Hydrogenedentes bacterium]|nr:twin-arginine translocation signal domain-containing protein [Candidatus Hydrogenedentota bacterium]
MTTPLTRRDFLKASAAAVAATGFAGTLLKNAPIAFAADEFYALDGLALAALVRNKEVTPLELLDAAIARTEALNPKINCMVTPMYERARDRAKQATLSGPFAGVPTLLKDLVDYEGVRTAFGSRMMMGNIAKVTDPFAQRMEDMGMVIFGKSATPEFGLLPTTEPAAFGPTNNPWDLSCMTGGSSGGAGASVAAGINPITQGSDGGGSIRIPACNCGVFGLKPSRGRVVPPSGPPRIGELSVRGFLSRSVRDSEAALVAATADGIDMPSAASGDAPPKNLRIAFSASDFNGIVAHPQVVEAVTATAKLCEGLGHSVEEAMPAIDGEKFTWAMLTLWSYIPWALIKQAEKTIGNTLPRPALESWTWGLAEAFEKQGGESTLPEAVAFMKLATEEMNAFLSTYDLLLLPVLAAPPLKTGEMVSGGTYDEMLEQVANYAGYTPPANATGLPAMSVPLHWTPDGLPVGSQFVGRLGEERVLIGLAKQLEEVQPWADRWAPTSAKFL